MLLSITFYYGLIYTQAINLYLADDFHLFKTVVWLQEGNGPQQGFGLFFDQHNEHRIVFPRLLTWLDYQLEGYVNIRTLNLLSSLVALGIAGLLALEFRKARRHPVYFLPVIWLLFQPQSYDNLTYTISVIQLYGIVFLAFAVFKLLDGPGTLGGVGALLVAVIATFSHGNGMFTFAIGLLILIAQKRFRMAGWWSLAMTACLLTYFYQLEKGQSGDWMGSLNNPVRFIQGIGVFAGAVTEVFSDTNYVIPALLGWTLLGILAFTQGDVLWRAMRKWQQPKAKMASQESYFLLGCALFLGATAFIVALFRSWMGLSALIQPRYVHFSSILVAVSYLAILKQEFRHTSWRVGFLTASLVLSLAFTVAAYWKYTPLVLERRQLLIADAYNWQQHQMTFGNHASFDRNIRDVYNTAIRQGIMRPGSYFFPRLQQCLRDSCVEGTDPARLRAQPLAGTTSGFEKPIWSIAGTLAPSESGQPFLVLRRGQDAYLLGTRPQWNGIRHVLTTGKLVSPHYAALLNSEPLAAGRYAIDLILVGRSGEITRRPSGQQIVVGP